MTDGEGAGKKGGERRRHFTVSPKVRTFYVITWTLALSLVVLIAAFAYFAQKTAPRVGGTVWGIQILTLLIGVGSLLAVVALLLALYSTIHTHRLIGAAYHIQTVVEKVREGDGDVRIQLREDDYFHDLAGTLNDWIEEKQKKT